MEKINKTFIIGLSPNNKLVKEYKNSLSNLTSEQFEHLSFEQLLF